MHEVVELHPKDAVVLPFVAEQLHHPVVHVLGAVGEVAVPLLAAAAVRVLALHQLVALHFPGIEDGVGVAVYDVALGAGLIAELVGV